jgi:hypothetical protein
MWAQGISRTGSSIWTLSTSAVRAHIYTLGKPAYDGPDVVWVESKQIGLIDSVFRNYYLPPIIFGALVLAFSRDFR